METAAVVAREKRHKDTMRWSKVLTPDEMRMIADWLCGRKRDAITGEYLDRATPEGAHIDMIYNMLLCTGLRATELAGLKIKDCPCVLHSDAIEIYMGKGKKTRMVPVCDELKIKLNDYINRFRQTFLPRWISKEDISRFVFYNKCRRPYLLKYVIIDDKGRETVKQRASSTFYELIKKIGKTAGLYDEETGYAKPLHPHMLRHTFAVECLRKGIILTDLKEIMGHSSIRITEQYLHLMPNYLERAKLSINHVAK